MTPERFQVVADVFREACRRGGGERDRYLDEACQGDAELRSDVDRLLAAHDDAPGDTDFLAQAQRFVRVEAARRSVLEAETRTTTDDHEGLRLHDHELDEEMVADVATADRTYPRLVAPTGVPDRVGQYRIRRLIASGGMASVYEAMQDRPRRIVALKLIKPELSSPSVLKRLEFEAQILGRLRHPNIAQVYEAGTHTRRDTEVPFFAMEYIPDPRPITTYADERHLPTRGRLEMFVRVVDAVAHGHERGVIHRDLKPSNILVDGSGTPKVIDFGVARATDSDMAVTTIQTHVGQLIGTLQYMSPEQCDADPLALDARSDIYALGVVLYELLCGQLPYDISKMFIHEALRTIRQEAPARPSTIDRMLRGDIETIALKALEKDRALRYAMAADLRDDIERYLSSRPILARPPSLLYRTRVLLRRNKGFTAAATFFVIVSILAVVGDVLGLVIALWMGLVGTGIGFIRANRAKIEATQQRDEAEAERNRALVAEGAARQQREEADDVRRRAEREAGKAQAINDFLVQDMLGAANPMSTRGEDMTVREVLENAARQVGTAFEEQPELEIALRDAIATVFRSLGRLSEAETHLRVALELRHDTYREDHPEVAANLNGLARLLYERSDHEAAEGMYREALRMRRGLLGEKHPHVAVVLGDLASVLRARGDYDAAERCCREAIEINREAYGEDHPAVATSLNKLAKLLAATDRLEDAEPLLRTSLAIQRRALGSGHLHVAFTLSHLASVLQRRREHIAAEELLREALETFRARAGPQHRYTLTAMNNLAKVLVARGEREEAARVLRELLRFAADAPTIEVSFVPKVEATLQRISGS